MCVANPDSVYDPRKFKNLILTDIMNFNVKNDKIKEKAFWQSINVLITKPHVVNKRLWGSTILNRYYINPVQNDWKNVWVKCKLKVEKSKENFCEILKNIQVQIIEDGETDFEIILLQLLPKSYHEAHAFQVICIDKSQLNVSFYDVSPEENQQKICPPFPYHFVLQNDDIILNSIKDNNEKSHNWLKDTVLSQVIKWCKEISSNQSNICNESLALVPNDKYYMKYNDLKLKYGKEMVKVWPECTDPTKFVYEDIAIATYLLLLWECDLFPQKFVDIGCGNGLLVYILTMEGHIGYGVDVRKRKIWDFYPANVELKESTVTPSNMNTFSDTDWIIGNHSDELTPWIPVIAAQNSYKCNFFLLPCCAYNFDGTKYQRKNSSQSQYTEYLEYIKELCEQCGFITNVDRLKIPSTKRICLVGKMRTIKEDEYDKHKLIIQDMVNGQIGLYNKVNESSEFKTRDPIEKVRNCTQIDKNVIKSIIQSISSYLLEGCDLEPNWTKGKKVAIGKLVELLKLDELKVLKSECGGLQTLLRNNHHIFEVHKGCVQLRYPRTMDEVKHHAKSKNNTKLKMQIKKCWFYNNHPKGCPLDKTVCSFLHEKLS